MSLLAEGSASVSPADGSDRGTWRVCPSYAVDQLRDKPKLPLQRFRGRKTYAYSVDADVIIRLNA
jgi:hypothetical protein